MPIKDIILQRKLAVSLLLIVCVCTACIYMRFLYISELRRQIFKDDAFPEYDIDAEGNQLYTQIKQRQIRALGVRYMKQAIKRINEENNIFNIDRYGPLRKEAPVFVVQVSNRIAYLNSLLESMEHVTGIGNSLIIFSHSYYDEEINNVVKGIRFAKVMQIFYPYSVQLHPYIYPGQDENYCDHNWVCWKATGQRDSTLTEKKLHWWWMMNHVFDRLMITEDYEGRIIFLEDDYDQYLTQDFVYIVKLMEKMLPHVCPKCYILNLGAYSPDISQYHVTEGILLIELFGNTEFNIGIAFNRTLWNIIKNSTIDFCYFNDYRWDVTLYYIVSRKPEGKMYMLTSEGNRVFQIDKCDDKRPDCEVDNKKQVVYDFLERIRRGLYPLNVDVKEGSSINRNISEIGDWNDVRDHELCKYIASKEFNVRGN